MKYDYKVKINWIPPPFKYDHSVKLYTKDKKNKKYDKNNETDINPKECCYTVVIESSFSEKGWNGIELIVLFDNKMYTFDDRSGIIYEISAEFEAIPGRL